MEDEMNWYLMVWKKYAQFSGRSRRKELWMFTLFNCLFSWALFILGLVFKESVLGSVFMGLYCIYLLAVLVPCLSVTVRRLHDLGKSGWWWFIILVPIAGPIILLVFMCLDSEPGTNQYGPSPK
jgi:uncharacterized membrane protein YhaH (DUF805 family)